MPWVLPHQQVNYQVATITTQVVVAVMADLQQQVLVDLAVVAVVAIHQTKQHQRVELQTRVVVLAAEVLHTQELVVQALLLYDTQSNKGKICLKTM
jgi:hypothetical protein